MENYNLGHLAATRTLLIVLINNLRGRGVLDDELVTEIFDETLGYLESVHADLVQKFGASSDQAQIAHAARKSIEEELQRESSYGRREKADD